MNDYTFKRELIEYSREKCYCGYLKQMKDKTDLDSIPQLCIYCQHLSNFFLWCDKKRLHNQEAAKGVYVSRKRHPEDIAKGACKSNSNLGDVSGSPRKSLVKSWATKINQGCYICGKKANPDSSYCGKHEPGKGVR